MTFTPAYFKYLTEKHSSYGSWAIWEYSKSRIKEKSIQPIYDNLTLLHNKYIIIGLNISAAIETWTNFRGGMHDRKLKYAFNDSPLKGAYMTDLFKGIVNPNSKHFHLYIKNNLELIKENVMKFTDEMNDLKISPQTIFVVLGTETSITGKLYKGYFQKHFINNEVIYHKHYSSRGSDKDWVQSIWTSLKIDADFNNIIARYK